MDGVVVFVSVRVHHGIWELGRALTDHLGPLLFLFISAGPSSRRHSGDQKFKILDNISKASHMSYELN